MVRAVAKLDAIPPPAEVQKLHEQFLRQARTSTAAVGALVTDVRSGVLACRSFADRAYELPSNDRAQAVLDRMARRGYLVGLTGE